MSGGCPRLGFTLRLRIAPISAPEANGVLRELDALLHSLALARTPSARSNDLALTLWREGSQADHLDREAVRAWAFAHPDVDGVDVGLLFDLDQPL